VVGHHYGSVQLEQFAITEETCFQDNVSSTRGEHLTTMSAEGEEIDFIQPLIVRQHPAV